MIEGVRVGMHALIAWSTTEEAARRTNAEQLREAADRDTALADQLPSCAPPPATTPS